MTGMHLGLLGMRCPLVTDMLVSSVHLTSRVNSTAQFGQKSSHVQSCRHGTAVWWGGGWWWSYDQQCGGGGGGGAMTSSVVVVVGGGGAMSSSVMVGEL